MATKSLCIAFCLLATVALHSSAQPIDFDPQAEELQLTLERFEPVPIRIERVKRQEVFGGVNHGPDASIASHAGVAGPLYENNGHRLDGAAQVSKTWKPTGPTIVGGGLDYNGPRGGASVWADHNRHLGTNVQAEGRYNVYTSPNRMTSVDAYGGYQRSFGGAFGTSRPNYNVGVGLNHRF